MKYFILSTLLLFSFFPACRSTQHAPEDFSGRQLHFGSGGGFTGMVKTYCLLEDGQLYVKEEMRPGEGSFVFVKKIKNKATKGLFEQADSLGLQEMDFQHPGNMYTFISIGEGEDGHRITWGAENPQVRPEIQEFYASLQDLTR